MQLFQNRKEIKRDNGLLFQEVETQKESEYLEKEEGVLAFCLVVVQLFKNISNDYFAEFPFPVGACEKHV